MNKYLILLLAIFAIVSILIAGYVVNSNLKKASTQATTQTLKKIGSAAPKTKIIPAINITLTNTGFNPQILTIGVGDRVAWFNKSGTTATVNSDNYPTNLLYPMLNFGQFKNGSSFSTIFTKAGTYTYYNFLSANQSQKGTIIVK